MFQSNLNKIDGKKYIIFLILALIFLGVNFYFASQILENKSLMLHDEIIITLLELSFESNPIYKR